MPATRALAFTVVTCLALLIASPRTAGATWPTDPHLGVPLCTAAGSQMLPALVSDGAGGAIVTWLDKRSNADFDIYAQRISAAGTVQWASDGVALCTGTGGRYDVGMVGDGEGGAIVTWGDSRSGNTDVYAQRVSATGMALWTANGVAICTAPNFQTPHGIVSDGAGGAIIAWIDHRGANQAVYAQRVSAAGSVQWTADGVAVCSASDNQASECIVSDGVGGAIVAWSENRTGSYFDIYAQRIAAWGVAQWASNGVALCTAAWNQYTTTIISDGAHGAIVNWEDWRNGIRDYFTQRISADGAPMWLADGVAACAATAKQDGTIASDGTGGAIATWTDLRSGNGDIYCQRISAGGTVQWAVSGVPLCAATGSQQRPTAVTDGAGGVVVTWMDPRNDGSPDIYAQRISADGAVQWTADGVAVCTALGGQYYPDIVSDCAGGAIITWYDSQVYAQRVQSSGQLGGDATDVPASAGAAFALDPVRPNPSRGNTLTVHFTLVGAATATLELFDVAGRCVVRLEVGSLGAGGHTVELGEGRRLMPGLYFVCLRQGASEQVRRVALVL